MSPIRLTEPMRTALLRVTSKNSVAAGTWHTPHDYRDLSRSTFDALVRRGLLEQSPRSRNYKITDEGFQLADEYREWRDQMASLETAVKQVQRVAQDPHYVEHAEKVIESLMRRYTSLSCPIPTP